MRSLRGCSKTSSCGSGPLAAATSASGTGSLTGSLMRVFCLTRAAGVNGAPWGALAGRELEVASVQCLDLSPYCAHVGIVGNDVIGGLETRRARHLRVQDCLRLRG